jgi:hypothetical protein
MLSRIPLAERGRFLASAFPRVFRLASALAGMTLLAGVVLSYMMTGWRQLDVILTNGRGIALVVGGLLGLLLGLFHFLAESRLEPRIQSASESRNEEEIEAISRLLRIIPRLGLGVMLAIFVSMMIAARGL